MTVEKEIIDVIEFCGEFNYVKENQNQDNLMLLLDNFIIVMESLVDSEFNINNNGGENAETIPIEI